MFSHNEANEPEYKTTRMFRPFRQVSASLGRQKTSFDRVLQVAAPGKSLLYLNVSGLETDSF